MDTRKNRARNAVSTANARTRAQFGRLGQTRMANLFKPADGPHNIVARAQRNLRKEELAKIETIVDSTKASVPTLQGFKKQLSDSIRAARSSGSSIVKLELPMGAAVTIVHALTFVLGLAMFIAYWGVNLFIGFFSAGTVMMGNTPKSIITMLSQDSNNV